MPFATASHAVMPPNTLTNTLLTSGSPRMTSSPSAITFADAPPPMSRKFAGFTPPWLLPRVGDDVQRGHHQARAVADDPDLPALELDVVQVLGLGLGLQRVLGALVDQVGVAGVAEVGVGVQGDLAVERDHLVLRVADQRVHLDQRRVLADEGLPQLDDHVRGLVGHGGGDLPCGDDLGGLGLVHPGDRVHRDPRQRLGPLDGQLLDLHAALGRAHRQERAVAPVEQEREVVLLGDVAGLGDQHPVHGVALDVHPEDGRGLLLRLLGRVASFTPPALPRPPVLTCALTTTVPPSSAAAAAASSGVSTVRPGSTGTPCAAKRSFAWYS